LLNQDDAHNATRNILYSEYIFAARREKMQVYLDAIARIETIEKKLVETNDQLEKNRVSLETEQTALIAQRDERKQLVSAADISLQTKDDSLDQMEQDRKALQKIIAEIEQQRALAKAKEEQRLKKLALIKQQEEKKAMIKRQQEQALKAQMEQKELQAKKEMQALNEQQKLDEQQKLNEQQKQKNQLAIDEQEAQQIQKEIDAMPDQPDTAEPAPARRSSASPAYSAADLSRLQSQSFAQRKGQLPWPVKGKLVTRFGDQRQGSVTWDGMRIQAPNGSDVRAVHGGRVMYADSLRGMGLLIVLDHGDGYMSLYAHNDVLLHAAGEWVNPGDSVARAGNSGGEKESGLYFEIRQNGQPVNPLPWLTKR
jgi:septal ring factor EnvC (AmiA/AmiB activator)